MRETRIHIHSTGIIYILADVSTSLWMKTHEITKNCPRRLTAVDPWTVQSHSPTQTLRFPTIGKIGPCHNQATLRMSKVATESKRHHPGEGMGDEEWWGSFFSLAVGEPLFPLPLLLPLLLLLLFGSDLTDPVWAGPAVASVPFVAAVGFRLSEEEVIYIAFTN